MPRSSRSAPFRALADLRAALGHHDPALDRHPPAAISCVLFDAAPSRLDRVAQPAAHDDVGHLLCGPGPSRARGRGGRPTTRCRSSSPCSRRCSWATGSGRWAGSRSSSASLGVLLILKPQAEGSTPTRSSRSPPPIFYALAMILTRSKCRDEHPLILSLSLNVSFVVVGLLATDPDSRSCRRSLWAVLPDRRVVRRWVRWIGWPWRLLAPRSSSAVSALQSPTRSARPATVAAFDFAYVGFAALWGILFFDECSTRSPSAEWP